MCGVFVYGVIFFICDYDLEVNKGNVFVCMLEYKEVIIFYFSWVLFFFGFYIFGFYVYNDVM